MSLVLFDLDGVLFHDQPAHRWRGFAEQTGLDEATVHARLSGSGYAEACDLGRYRGNRAYQEGIRLLGSRLTMERFVDLWISAFTPNGYLLELALAVKQRTPVALLSNSSDLVRQGLEARWPAELAPFMPRIYSADLGLSKPDPRAFTQAANLLGQAPTEILLVDDAAANTSTAAALGFQVHRYRDPATLSLELESRGLL